MPPQLGQCFPTLPSVTSVCLGNSQVCTRPVGLAAVHVGRGRRPGRQSLPFLLLPGPGLALLLLQRALETGPVRAFRSEHRSSNTASAFPSVPGEREGACRSRSLTLRMTPAGWQLPHPARPSSAALLNQCGRPLSWCSFILLWK